MSLRSHLATIGMCLAIALFVFYLIKRRKLREQYALLWVGVCAVMLVLASWRSLLESVAELLGIYYAPSALFLLGMVFSLGLLLHFSVVLTRLHRDNRRLATRLAELGATRPESNREGDNPGSEVWIADAWSNGEPAGNPVYPVSRHTYGSVRDAYEVYRACASDPRD